MTLVPLFLICLTLLNACGLFKQTTPARSLASVEAEQDVGSEYVEIKLNQMHIYYVMAQKQMMLFDQSSGKLDTSKRFGSTSYLKLQSIKSQVDKIEIDLLDSIKENNTYSGTIEAINKFATNSLLHAYSVDNLLARLNLINGQDLSRRVTKDELEKEVSRISPSPEYQVFEQNIEHLSFMFESQSNVLSKHFYPSTSAAGNITGDEFPSKVWSITFDDGPQGEISSQIVAELEIYKLTATFFQTTNGALQNKRVARSIKSSGMEIASNGYSGQQLTKVAGNGLEEEISIAVKELNQMHKILIKFFRLPLGPGAAVPVIREKIVTNDLIHVLWNVDSLSWVPQPHEQVSERTINLMNKTAKDAGIIRLHDTYRRTALAMPKIMKHLKQQNRRVCTINVITDQMNKGLDSICP